MSCRETHRVPLQIESVYYWFIAVNLGSLSTMWTFVCEHGAEAGVIGAIVWFFAPCIHCETDLHAGVLSIPHQQRRQLRLVAA